MENLALSFYQFLGIFNLALIVSVYLASVYYNLLLITKTNWTPYSWIKLALAFSELLVSLIYGYLLIRTLFGPELELCDFGAMHLRPIIALLGIALLFASRARHNDLYTGGERWTLKISRK